MTLEWDGGGDRSGPSRLGVIRRPVQEEALAARFAETTIRGSSIDQLGFGAILAHAQQEAGKLSEAPGPTPDAGLTREVVELSTTTHLPHRAASITFAADRRAS